MAAALFDMDGATLAAEKTSAHTFGESPIRDRISQQPALSLERDFAGCCEFGLFGFTLISSFLLPENMRDWLPASDPVWLLISTVAELDTSGVA